MTGSRPPLLAVEKLTVSYRQHGRQLDALREVDLRIQAGQTYGLVGESGSGKTTLALAIMHCLPGHAAIREGQIALGGQPLQGMSPEQRRRLWRERIKLVPQNPLSSLNPSLRVGEQIVESLDPALSPGEAQERALELLGMVRLADPERVARSYPHQLSGGMQQRVMIAMALGGDPELLVLDEPTTNLDVTTEAAILDLFKELIESRRTAVLYVSHNLGVVAQICDRVAVLYAGELVEDATVQELYHQPLHPYTRGLLDSVPRIGQSKQQVELRPIRGQIPQLDRLPPGCVFAPRCPLASDFCARNRPPLDEPTTDRRVRCHDWPEILAGRESPRQSPPAPPATRDRGARQVLEIRHLDKRFSLPRTLRQLLRREPARQLRAVDDISLQIRQGRTLGLVGESGSGKTTIARCVIGLVERSGGEITLLDLPLAPRVEERDLTVLRHLQMVFQNPEEALNPHLTVGETLRRPLIRLGGQGRAEAERGIARLLEAVGLPASYASRTPGQLSGGEKQRVAIARAFASHPDLILFDESLSALDMSVQATILNLLNGLQRERQSAYLFISHDLAVVGYLADEIAVIYLGHLVEVGRTEEIFAPPYHPYTEALLSAIPLLDPNAEQSAIRLEGEVPSPTNIPPGCRFHSRCPRFLGDICVNEFPPWQRGENGHQICCHIPLDELKRLQQRPFHFSESSEES